MSFDQIDATWVWGLPKFKNKIWKAEAQMPREKITFGKPYTLLNFYLD